MFQQLRRILPALLSASAIWAQATSARVDEIFQQWNYPKSAGCAVGVLLDGKVVHERGYGMANLEHNIKIDSQSAFYLGSTSKQFTALTVLQLEQQGKLSLADPIRRWLPDLPAYMQPVTIRHLLEHSSGIRDYFTLWSLKNPADDANLTDDETLRIIVRQKELAFKPGDEFLYSNSGYFLLSLIVRRAAYSNLPHLSQRGIFEPLKMSRTFYHDNRFAQIPKRATGYSPRERADFAINTATPEVLGDGGVYTTLEDMLLWARALDTPQGYAQTIGRMIEPAKLNGGGVAEYGKGMMLKKHRGLEMMNHPGGIRGYRSDILRIPQRKLTVVCLCNSSDAEAGRLTRAVADVWLGDVKEPAPVKLSDGELARKAGVFRDRTTGEVIQVASGNGALGIDWNGYQMVLVPETPMRFRSFNAPIHLVMEYRAAAGAKDEPSFLRVESEVHKPANFERVELLKAMPANVAEYAGDYFSDEAQAKFGIRYTEQKLVLLQEGQPVGVLQPTITDHFRTATINIQFERDGAKKVSALRFSTGRVRRVLFTRVAQ